MTSLIITNTDEFRQALEKNSFNKINVKAEKFLKQAVAEKRDDVKQILLDIVLQPVHDSDSNFSVAYALSWLANYEEPALIPLFVHFLENESTRWGALDAVIHSCINGFIPVGEPTVVNALLRILPLDEVVGYRLRERILEALSIVKAVQAIDQILEYINDSYPPNRRGAIVTLIRLSAYAGRDDVIDIVERYLDDPNPWISKETALNLKIKFPERYADLDLMQYLERKANDSGTTLPPSPDV